MDERRRTRLAWAIWGLSITPIGTSIIFAVLVLPAPRPERAFGFPGYSNLIALAFGSVGLVLARRQPANWLRMADRLEAVGGSLDVWSEPGRGTRVRGAIPVSDVDLSPQEQLSVATSD